MSDDLPNSDAADQLHDDLFVKRLTDSDNTEFSNDLEKTSERGRGAENSFQEGFSTASLGGFRDYDGNQKETDMNKDSVAQNLACVGCLLYTSPSPRDRQKSRMPSSA